MKNRLTELFRSKREDILSVFYTAGYPKFDDTIAIAQRLEAGGVDMIEIGIPFSDPIADGPVIQESNQVAIRNGMTVKRLLSQVHELRKTVRFPILLMGYLNPVLQFGFAEFCEEVAASGVDGLILPDLPLEVYESHYQKYLDNANLIPVFLVAPTTSPERIRRIDSLSGAFIYAVAASSVTGTRREFSSEQLAYFERLRAMNLSHPILTGFGIGNAALFKEACHHVAGAIIGSAFIERLRRQGKPGNDVEDFVRELRGLPVGQVD